MSARGHQRPQFIGATVGDQLAELDRPVALGAKIVAPRQRAQRIAMQDVLDGEADRAMHLMGNGAALLRRLRAADFAATASRNTSSLKVVALAMASAAEAAASAAADSPASRARLCCTAWNSKSSSRRQRARWNSARKFPASIPARPRSAGRATPPISISLVWSKPCGAGLIVTGCTLSSVTVSELSPPRLSPVSIRHLPASTSAIEKLPFASLASTAKCFAALANGTPRHGLRGCRRH